MKNRMEALQRQVAMAKKQYRQALKQLEKISEEIHQSREIEALLARERSRGVGVGAESESTISDADDEAKRLSLTQLNLGEDKFKTKSVSNNGNSLTQTLLAQSS